MIWQQEIEEHYRRNWGVEGERCPFNAGPIHDLPSCFSVLAYPPHGDRKMWTYATCCMSQPDDEFSIELHMFSPCELGEIVELLVVTSHFHRTAAHLNLWHTVNFGRPWLASSLCDHGLISLPYLDGPELEDLNIGSIRAKFYWLIPVTKSEVEFKKLYGIESLEQKFERRGLNYLNPSRKSVV